MSFVAFALALYFAAVLGVSGLAKLDHPDHFTATLRRQKLLPPQGVTIVGRGLPWVELVLAGVLLAGLSPVLTAIAVLVLCCGFLLAESIVLWTGRDSDCGCYGAAHPQRVDGASVATSTALVVLAALHLFVVVQSRPIAREWRLGMGGLLGSVLCWLAWRTLLRLRQRSRSDSAQVGAPAPHA